MGLSKPQARALRAAADTRLRLSGDSAWIDGISPFTAGSVRHSTMLALVDRGLVIVDWREVNSLKVKYGRAYRPAVTDAGHAALQQESTP
jgi:hypothetical protein